MNDFFSLRRAMSRAMAAAVVAALAAVPAIADVSKASDWVGRTVVTAEGDPLGRIEDLALDVESGQLAFWVVSVGSFLIEESLIAVHPDALGPSAQGKALVLHGSDLTKARRFNADSWPAAPDVLPSAAAGDGPLVTASADAEEAPTGFGQSGSAMISDGRRQAIFADGERRIERVGSGPAAEPARVAAKGPGAGTFVDPERVELPSFERLDSDGDGVLDRREIGPRLGRGEPFPTVDVDGNGTVDSFEFDLLKDSRG
jgi:sporulation protein YlmC with PRC-barrel domain